MNIQKKDAYTKLFENIDKELFFKGGIEDIIYVENHKIEEQWEQLKKDVFNNETVYIRGYGRDAKGTDLFFKLYQKMFGNTNIKKDSSNNAEPTKLLEELTSYSKKGKKEKTHLINYQISHLFGKTKNPLLFACPWNIAYVPKYLDPFTGHETQGQYSEQFKQMTLPFFKDKFKDYIDDYNSIIRNKILHKIDESLQFVKSTNKLSEKDYMKFETSVRNELSEI